LFRGAFAVYGEEAMSKNNGPVVRAVGIRRLQAEQAYAELLKSLEDLTDGEARAMPLTDGRADLYCGPILGIRG
jgi:hypothetical protein